MGQRGFRFLGNFNSLNQTSPARQLKRGPGIQCRAEHQSGRGSSQFDRRYEGPGGLIPGQREGLNSVHLSPFWVRFSDDGNGAMHKVAALQPAARGTRREAGSQLRGQA